MKYNIAVIEGDGIGPEIMRATAEVMEHTGGIYGHQFSFNRLPAGGVAIDEYGIPLPEHTLEQCRAADGVLLGAVGGPKWDTLPGHLRPERALLGLRKGLGLYANMRPARLIPALRSASPLREDISAKGFDIMMVRELTGGMYFGDRGRRQGEYGEEAYDTESYSVMEIERIGVKAFETARARRKKLCSIDKANVLESSRLWRETMHKLAERYSDVEYSDMLVDNAAMQFIIAPSRFDVIVTSNMFGDILSDELSQLTGSIGLLPSASLGEGQNGIYEPVHGSAPDIAGRGEANPVASILSAAMLMRMSLGLTREAAAVEAAVEAALEAGYRTKDIAAPGGAACSLSEMTAAVIERIV
ncbi:MAG: 3-isopropylmalate dehydrogenase [Christensenellales bacterium]|jgi:3-isopropylmalate dehydrogenase